MLFKKKQNCKMPNVVNTWKASEGLPSWPHTWDLSLPRAWGPSLVSELRPHKSGSEGPSQAGGEEKGVFSEWQWDGQPPPQCAVTCPLTRLLAAGLAGPAGGLCLQWVRLAPISVCV